MSAPTITIGVDPGISGALAAVDVDGTLLDAVDMPVVNGAVAVPLLHELVERIGRDRIAAWVVEQVHSMPGQGVASMFKFGRAYGTALGFGGGIGLPVLHVAPQAWKAAYRLNGKPKDAARALAIELWPEQAGLLKRKRDGGRADAALIARWHADTMRAAGWTRKD